MRDVREAEQAALAVVRDEESFVAFLRVLADERLACERVSGHGDWEHGTIGHYLDAAAARAEDAGYTHSDEERADNPWRRAARILLYGKYYE